MDWFLHDNGFRHERVKSSGTILSYHDFQISKLIFHFEIFFTKRKNNSNTYLLLEKIVN